MAIWKKFLSRKFLIQLGGFIFSVLAVLYGEDNEALLMVGQIGVIVFPLSFAIIEAILDGRAMNVVEHVPSFARTIHDLVQLYENRYGENGVSNFIQDFMGLLRRHFEEEDVDGPEVTE